MKQSKIHYTQSFGKRTFGGLSLKDAYLKACKWYAANVIANEQLQHIQVEFVKDSKHNKVTLLLFATLPEKEVLEQHCECCREMHSSFFINEATNCNRCSALGYQKRLTSRLSVKRGYYRELLIQALKGKGEGLDSVSQEREV